MKFGVILPTYNRPDHILTAIQSILSQTYENWNLLICNDGSSKDYASVEPSLQDPRIHYTRNPENRGCNYTRNTAIEMALKQGCDYLIFLDDEESLDPRCLEVAASVIEQHPDVGWFISNTFGERKKSTREITEERFYSWIDDYMYGDALAGDKTHVICTKTLGDLRLDGRFRASNIWRFRLTLSTKTKLWGYPYPSKYIQYLDTGITKNASRYPRTWLELYSRFARHWFAIRIRPTKWIAYKYLAMELLKTPKRALYILIGKSKPKQKPSSETALSA